MWPPAGGTEVWTKGCFALRGEFLSERSERNQRPRPPSLAPAGQFTLRIAGAATRNFIALSAPPRTPLRESRRPCVVRTWQNMRVLTPPFASQNGEDFTGDKQYSPPRWRQRLMAAAYYPPGPPGPPDGTSDQQGPLQNGRLSVLPRGTPRLPHARRAFKQANHQPI